MKSYCFFNATLFSIILFSLNSYSQIWMKASDPPPGSNFFKVETGYENGNSAQFLLESSGLGLFKSTDNGATWEYIGLLGIIGISAVLSSPSNFGEYVVSTSEGVYKTIDDGATWQHYTSGIEGLIITDICKIHPTQLLGLLASTAGNGVFFSDDGETWTPYGTGIENKIVTSIEYKYDEELQLSRIFATIQGEGVWEYDFGTTLWTPINNGIPSLLNNTAINSNSQGELFVINADFGVCTSPNDPVFWTIDNSNFLFGTDIDCTQDGEVYFSSLGDGVIKRDPSGNYQDFLSGLLEINGYIDVVNLAMDALGFLWAAVNPLEPGGEPGIYRTVNPVTDIEDNSIVTPEDFRLEQNYPNPFNPSTTISYSIPNSSFVTIRVYDVLGNQIAEFVNEEKSIGVHEVTFDASNLSTGTYFYQLQAVSSSSNSGENFVETKKMILIK